jgi:ABC transporter
MLTTSACRRSSARRSRVSTGRACSDGSHLSLTLGPYRRRGMTKAVEAEGLRKQYGELVAVEELTLSLDAGQILGVLGPNGAGKTTAIRVLTTILSPDRGTFGVAGVPHTRPAEIRRRIGVLPESAGYPDRQTARSTLASTGCTATAARAHARSPPPCSRKSASRIAVAHWLAVTAGGCAGYPGHRARRVDERPARKVDRHAGPQRRERSPSRAGQGGCARPRLRARGRPLERRLPRDDGARLT